ncbi:lactam utilization lamB [Cordyceps militaris]|uniref:Lactam utilization lamB n=1 Tax=Cordyceps militaris TaxID=73501 RepID=A0A2H4SBZ6_CORMI|nr:lactam utilization lamB [Cordyceps militaris]
MADATTDTTAYTNLPWASQPIRIHCDMGEAFGNWTMGDDEAIMPHINSCSIACGFHAGDPMVMYKTIQAARRHGLAIGAHPSFPDLQGFGRREMKMDAVECEKMVIYQIGALKAFLDIEGIPLSHISPHGALYGVMCKDAAICAAVCRAARHFTAADGTTPVPVIGASRTLMETTCAAMGIPFVQEVIADLEYDAHGDCVITRTHDAVDLAALRVRVRDALRTGRIAGQGGPVDLKLGTAPLSLCVHSDTPGAVGVAAAVRQVVDEFNQQRFGVASKEV